METRQWYGGKVTQSVHVKSTGARDTTENRETSHATYWLTHIHLLPHNTLLLQLQSEPMQVTHHKTQPCRQATNNSRHGRDFLKSTGEQNRGEEKNTIRLHF